MRVIEICLPSVGNVVGLCLLTGIFNALRYYSFLETVTQHLLEDVALRVGNNLWHALDRVPARNEKAAASCTHMSGCYYLAPIVLTFDNLRHSTVMCN